MRTSDLDLATMMRLLGDLTAAYGKPFGAAAERQARVYYEVLRGCSCDEVEQAVRRACATLDRFPHPPRLRSLVMDARGKRPHTPTDLDHCPNCNTAYQWRRLPHWEAGPPPVQDLQCDCGWRALLRGYATGGDLATMGETDPFATDELRRRSRRTA